jgi:PHD/YefM family antitoxin component YafN of YafNO toxin-antitoxin module
MLQREEHSHPIIDVTQAGNIIHQLHEQVCGTRQRIHITRPNCDDACVMISRAELDSLEKAIEIFADTEAFSSMCRMLSQIIASSGDIASSPSYSI